ncbi:hypothetical protein PM082_010076 [Marasmius tenuissimus]|nr:hypothetical protein PM082_010076 [Marasmius tenuissimus]
MRHLRTAKDAYDVLTSTLNYSDDHARCCLTSSYCSSTPGSYSTGHDSTAAAGKQIHIHFNANNSLHLTLPPPTHLSTPLSSSAPLALRHVP